MKFEKSLKLLYKITGGYPMKRIDNAFIDIVSSKPVYYYKDTLGRVWLAEHAFATFRVKPSSYTRNDYD